MQRLRFTILIVVTLLSIQSFGQQVSDFLLPQPKELIIQESEFLFPSGRIICDDVTSKDVLRSLKCIQNNILCTTGHNYPIAGIAARNEEPVIAIEISEELKHKQGYILSVSPSEIKIIASDEAGLFYATASLKQLLEFYKSEGLLPVITINDWPDFERRGVMLDISRDQVPTMESLFSYVDQMAAWKINEIQLYTEHTFAYKNHKKVWENASPMTAEQIIELDAYCKDRHIDLVPNQNAFGHMNRWLIHDEYLHLAECPTPAKTIWGMMSKTSISPAEPGSLELVEELFDELLPNFSSDYLNIGCDETVELGCGKSKALCEEQGKGRVYLEFLLELRKLVEKNGKKVQFWGDIVLHHPELIPELPKDMTTMIWGYEDYHPFDKQCQIFKESGLQFYVCPGVSGWNGIIGRNNNAFGNLRNAAINGSKHGAKGFLNTSWGDGGNWHPLSVCQPAYLYGAALSWGAKENEDIDIPQFLNRQVFQDNDNEFAQALVKLGDAYLETGVPCGNSSLFFQILKQTNTPVPSSGDLKKMKKENLVHTIAFIDEQLEVMNKANITCSDSQQVKDEVTVAAELAKHACKQAIYKLEAKKGAIANVSAAKRSELKQELQELITRHQTLWVVRNHPGGLSDSVKKLNDVLKYY